MSAMISHRHRCIFLGVPKCASTSVGDWLSTQGQGRPIVKPWWYGGVLCHRARALVRVVNLYPDYFTFAFVRDPYERFVSLYLDASRRFAAQRAGGWNVPAGLCIRDFAELCSELLRDCGDLWGREAQAFFRTHGEREYGPGRIKLGYLGWLVFHAQPQTRFLPDCNAETLLGVRRVNRDPLSFIGTLDDFAADLHRVARILGLPAPEALHRNSSGWVAGSGRRERYRAYFDRETRRLVEDLYAADLEFTGCRFDDARTALVLPAGSRATARTPSGRLAKRRGKRFLMRLWFRLSSLEVRLEEGVRRHAMARRILRPLRRLRGLAR